MYLDHEGNRAGDISPSTIEAPRTPNTREGGRYECRFHASQNHKDPERGKTTRAPPSEKFVFPSAEGQPVGKKKCEPGGGRLIAKREFST